MRGTLKEAINQADIFIGVSAPNVLTKELVQTMNEKAIVFAMANPIPEIFPEDALEAGANCSRNWALGLCESSK